MLNRSRRLYDVAHRHQVYLEGLKEYQLNEFAAAMLDMEDQIRALVLGVGVESLDGLTRRELNKLLTQLAKVQDGALKGYVRRLYAFLRNYLAIDSDMYNEVVAEESGIILVPVPGSPSTILGEILDTPLSANGQIASDLIAAFIASVIGQTANEVRKALVNHSTIAELVRQLVGTNAAAYKDGLFNRLINQGATNIRTLMQQVFTAMSDRIFQLYTNRYMWSSVMDDRTTEICQHRNGKVYIYGEGPMPPAHYNCRSVTVPVMMNDTAYRGADDFGEWLADQDPDFWQDALPASLYNALREARLNQRDLNVARAKPINLDQYREKRSIIATGR